MMAQARDSLESLRNDLNTAVTGLQNQITALQAQVDAQTPPFIYNIGATGPAGGIVFYVTVTNGETHGLEAARGDLGFAPWGCTQIIPSQDPSGNDQYINGPVIEGADGTAVGTGAQNTADILAGCNESGIAAELADNYQLNGFSDWFLPSKDELNLLHQQRAVVGMPTNRHYWSSSESGILGYDTAWSQIFTDGQIKRAGKYANLSVRPIRAF